MNKSVESGKPQGVRLIELRAIERGFGTLDFETLGALVSIASVYRDQRILERAGKCSSLDYLSGRIQDKFQRLHEGLRDIARMTGRDLGNKEDLACWKTIPHETC